MHNTQCNSLARILIQAYYSVRTRRILAAILACLGLLNLVDGLHPHMQRVYVAITDISPGVAISDDQINTHLIPSKYLSHDVISPSENIIGKLTTIPLSAGQIITKNHIVDNLIPTDYLPHDPNARIVPVAVEDTALLLTAHPGQIVDIIAHGEKSLSNDESSSTHPEIIAHNAIIVSTIKQSQHRDQGGSLILFALNYSDAQRVAGIAHSELSFIFH